MTKEKIRSPIKCHGGKSYLVPWLLSFFPKNYETYSYIEPFGGGGNLLLRKNQSEIEVYNDADKDLAFIFYCLKHHGSKMVEELSKIEYSESSFNHALKHEKNGGIDDAVAELVARRMSRGGMKKHFSWSERKRGGQPGDKNAWDNFVLQLPATVERMKNVIVKWCDGIDLIKEWSTGDNCITYCDPPYMRSVRIAKDVYGKEMSEAEHIKMAEALHVAKGRILLSGYYSPAYAKLFKGWKMEVKEMPNHSSQRSEKERRIECLWIRS